MPQITAHLTIPDHELSFTFSRSSGPGGQHVNKVNSRVTLWFDLHASPSLSGQQKSLLHQRLATRINKEGKLWLVVFASRSQHANREAAVIRFATLLREALSEDKARLDTKIPRSSRQKRLNAKKHRAIIKGQSRGKVQSED
ncbi:MAG: alternative ribosome rescue aminoacyl-tRNA hydrolase ArfB [Desulfobulbaceae bacterium]|nr:alternative ribosome rescue aminoacyl-tRNA hydrolase ArfB [Desulfobulbaceae bacterium]